MLTFSETTGDLVVSAIPEPMTCATLAGAVALALVTWRRGGKRASLLEAEASAQQG
jgi:hypothetical protein